MGQDPEAAAQAVRDLVASSDDPLATVESLRDLLHELSPQRGEPVDRVRWIPIEKVEPNDYNPNKVAPIELQLLLKSIDHDGYTQPVVVIHDADRDVYVIVDGFHRYYVMASNEELRERCHGLLPCAVIEKDVNERMAATIRHNRARGKHSIQGMANMVFQMLSNGMGDADICNELGLEPEELLKLKHITGFAKLYADAQYSRAWLSPNQALMRKEKGGHGALDERYASERGS